MKLRLKLIPFLALVVGSCAYASSEPNEPPVEADAIFNEIANVCHRVAIQVPGMVADFVNEAKSKKEVHPFSVYKEKLGPYQSPVEKRFEEVVSNKVVILYNSLAQNRDLIAVTKLSQVHETTGTFMRITEKDCRFNLSDEFIPGYEKLK